MSSDSQVLDPSAMDRLKRIGGDRLVGKMLVSFDAFATEKVAEIRSATSAGSWRDAGQAAHALKSSAGNVGATELQRLSFEVECAGRDEDGERIPDLVGELIAAFEAAQVELAKIQNTGETS
jgi:HPt (histidine-containing phosphotransfer) domain-containing protein